MNALQEAIQKAGGPSALGRCIDESPQRICNWARRGTPVPLEKAVRIEMELSIPAERIRGDLEAEIAFLRKTANTG